MRVRLRANVEGLGRVSSQDSDLTDPHLERFYLVLLCDQCYRPIEDAADAYVVWRADEAWNDDGDIPSVVHTECQDGLLRSRFRYEDRYLIRMAPLSGMLTPLVEVSGLAGQQLER